jgi:hypothetical protein
VSIASITKKKKKREREEKENTGAESAQWNSFELYWTWLGVSHITRTAEVNGRQQTNI